MYSIYRLLFLTRTHAQPRSHAHTRARMDAHKHTRRRRCALAKTHACTDARARTHALAYAPAHTHAHQAFLQLIQATAAPGLLSPHRHFAPEVELLVTYYTELGFQLPEQLAHFSAWIPARLRKGAAANRPPVSVTSFPGTFAGAAAARPWA
jgi:hypothetical protein